MDRFDLLFKNFFDTDSFFNTLEEAKLKYPVDIYEIDDKLILEIAAVGLKKEDVEIEIKDKDILHVSYTKDNEKSKECKILHKGIAKRSFDFGWKISNKFDLEKIEVSMEDGLLYISIPKAEEMKPKTVSIK